MTDEVQAASSCGGTSEEVPQQAALGTRSEAPGVPPSLLSLAAPHDVGMTSAAGPSRVRAAARSILRDSEADQQLSPTRRRKRQPRQPGQPRKNFRSLSPQGKCQLVPLPSSVSAPSKMRPASSDATHTGPQPKAQQNAAAALLRKQRLRQISVRLSQQALTRAKQREEKLKEAKYVISVIQAIRGTVNSTEWQQQRQATPPASHLF